jgi:hypothetical protein
MDPGSVLPTNIATKLVLSNSHTWGTAPQVRWVQTASVNDTLEVVIGNAATIASGDTITPSGANDEAGNTTTGTGTIDNSVPKVSAVKFNDVDTSATLTAADTIDIVFNRTMETALITGGATGNINDSFFIENPTTHAPRSTPWGTGAITVAWGNDGTGVNNRIRITLAAGFTIASGDLIWPNSTYCKPTGGGNIFNNGVLDIAKPTLSQVLFLDQSSPANATAEAGDKILFVFSEPVGAAGVTAGNMVLSAGSYGTSPTIVQLAPHIFEITLGTSPTITVGTATVNPAIGTTDLAGNADNTSTVPTITAPTLKPVTNVALSDTDTTSPGIDKNDISVTWTASSNSTNFSHYNVYILPEEVSLNVASNFRINNANIGPETTASYAGSTSTFAIFDDSRFQYIAPGTPPPPGSIFYPLQPGKNYRAYVVVCGDTACSTSSLPVASAPIAFTADFGTFMPPPTPTAPGTPMPSTQTGGMLVHTGGFNTQAPMVEGTLPWSGAIDIPTNIQSLGVKFSTAMDSATVTTSNAQLLLDNDSNGTFETTVATTITYSSQLNAALIKPSAALTASRKYRIKITTAVKGSTQLPLNFEYTSDFKTGAGADATPPITLDNKFTVENISTTATPTMRPEIGVRFNEDMDPSTFDNTSMTLEYDATSDATFDASQTPLTKVSGTVDYDPFSRVGHITFSSQLPTSKNFRLTVSGSKIKDLSGNFFDGDSDQVASGDYTFTFKTAASGDTTVPTILWADTDGYHLGIGFDLAMSESTVTNLSNFTLESPTGTVVSLVGKTAHYDSFTKELHIEGLSLKSTDSFKITATPSIKGLNNIAISATANSNTGTVHGFSGAGATACGATFDFGCGTHDVYAPTVMAFMPINVWPMNQIENQTSNYMVNVPLTQSVDHGSKVILEFPVGFKVAGAAMSESFMNNDINGPNGAIASGGTTADNRGVVKVSSVSANDLTRQVTLTISVDADGNGTGDTGAKTPAKDMLNFEVKGIVNGPASEMNFNANIFTGTASTSMGAVTAKPTGGYAVSITTKNSVGKTLEGPLTSMNFPIQKGGQGRIADKVTKPDKSTGVPNAKVFLDGPMIGHQEKTTDSAGAFTFGPGLPSSTAGTSYWVQVQPPEGYLQGSGQNFTLTDASPVLTNQVLPLQSASSSISGTLTHTAALGGKEIRVWASGPSGWIEKKTTLNAGTSTTYSISVVDGEWTIGVDPFFQMTGFMAGPPPEPPFMPPPTQLVSVTGTKTGVNFTLTSADKEIKGTVKDSAGSGLPHVGVWAFDPTGTIGAGGGAMTRPDGTFSIKTVA